MTTPGDLLDIILTGTRSERAAARDQVAATHNKGNPNLARQVEEAVAADPLGTITLDEAGRATVRAAGHEFPGGVFSTPTVGELLARVSARPKVDDARVEMWVLEGSGPLFDIGSLQAFAHESTLFQVASQFNCLESPGPYVSTVSDYVFDMTQGPRAAFSAFPGTLVRHYAARTPSGERFVQSDTLRTDGARSQIDLLADALPADAGRVEGGYLQISKIADPARAAAALTERFERIRVGVHDDVPVVFGHGWYGSVPGQPLIAQVLNSTLAAGLYGHLGDVGEHGITICRQLLRAAYLGVMLAAIDLGKRRAVVTCIGGGVFGNPHPLILECIAWAVDEVQRLGVAPLRVVVNTRTLDIAVDRNALAATCEQRGGKWLDLFQPQPG